MKRSHLCRHFYTQSIHLEFAIKCNLILSSSIAIINSLYIVFCIKLYLIAVKMSDTQTNRGENIYFWSVLIWFFINHKSKEIIIALAIVDAIDVLRWPKSRAIVLIFIIFKDVLKSLNYLNIECCVTSK